MLGNPGSWPFQGKWVVSNQPNGLLGVWGPGRVLEWMLWNPGLLKNSWSKLVTCLDMNIVIFKKEEKVLFG